MGGIPSTSCPFFLVSLKRVCRYQLLKASFIAYHSKLAENSLFKMLVPPIFIPKCQSVCLMLKAAPGLVNYTLTVSAIASCGSWDAELSAYLFCFLVSKITLFRLNPLLAMSRCCAQFTYSIIKFIDFLFVIPNLIIISKSFNYLSIFFYF